MNWSLSWISLLGPVGSQEILNILEILLINNSNPNKHIQNFNLLDFSKTFSFLFILLYKETLE